MVSSTTIIFVPGAWHSPECFNKVVKPLEAAGYKTDLVHLPSVGPSTPLPDWTEDVNAIRAVITNAVSTGQKVVLVVHSYGGVPGSEAVRDQDWETRSRNGLPGGVVHLFYCCSFLVAEGESLTSTFGGEPPWYQISEDRRLLTPMAPEKVFYNDMSEEETRAAVAALRPHSFMTLSSEVTYAAWRYVPTTYLYCLKDNAIPIHVQKMMVEGTAKGVPISTETVDASHSPFHSVPGEVVQAIKRAAGRTSV